MTSRARALSRVAFVVCGLVSIALSVTFKSVQSFMLDAGIWSFLSIFSIALKVMGVLSVVIAFLPSSWLDAVCKIGPDTQDRSSIPIKLLGCFAGFSYLLTVGLDLAPHSWHPTAQLVYLLCPACVLTVTIDPSFGTVALLLAPLNAAVYGSFGGVLGYFFLVVHNRL